MRTLIVVHLFSNAAWQNYNHLKVPGTSAVALRINAEMQEIFIVDNSLSLVQGLCSWT